VPGCCQKIKHAPDAFLIDGQGLAHPRRFGIASHLGLFLNKPTIGVALRTSTTVKPIFISVGNNCRLKDAIKITLACTAGFRIPKPTRIADHLVSKLKLKT